MLLPISLFHLFLVYVLFFKLYHPKSNRFNIFPGGPRTVTFLPILVHILSQIQSIGTMPLTSLKIKLNPKFINDVRRSLLKLDIL